MCLLSVAIVSLMIVDLWYSQLQSRQKGKVEVLSLRQVKVKQALGMCLFVRGIPLRVRLEVCLSLLEFPLKEVHQFSCQVVIQQTLKEVLLLSSLVPV